MSVSGRSRDTNVQIWDAQANKSTNRIENLLSWGWHARIVGTFINLKSVYDEVNGDLNRSPSSVLSKSRHWVFGRICHVPQLKNARECIAI
jgi:hypothetical protein